MYEYQYFPKKERIFTHAIAIAFFILFEIKYLQTIGIARGVQSFIIGYFLEVSFFLFSVRYYLPKVWSNNSNSVSRIVFVVLLVGLYTTVECFVGLLNLSIKQKHLVTKLPPTGLISCAWRAYYITTISIAYSFARYSIAKTKQLKEQEVLKIEAEKREAKLENIYLRSQINPHLLYNSLSFLHNKLAIKESQTAETVQLLVQMMEYALTNQEEDDKVRLSEDVSEMERYMELQQTLHDNKLQVLFTSNLYQDGSDLDLPPLLFINFIENVFKYGDLNNALNPARIAFHYDGSHLRFITENTFANTHGIGRNGIGLVNANARITKHYGEHSSIVITDNANQFKVDITITLL